MLTARNEIPGEIEQCTSKNKKKAEKNTLRKAHFVAIANHSIFAKFEHTRIYTVLQ